MENSEREQGSGVRGRGLESYSETCAQRVRFFGKLKNAKCKMQIAKWSYRNTDEGGLVFGLLKFAFCTLHFALCILDSLRGCGIVALGVCGRLFVRARLVLMTMALFGVVATAFAQAGGESPASPAVPMQKPPTTFFEIVFSGGPIGVAIMLVLIGLSLTSAYLVFEHAFSIRRQVILPDGIGDSVRQAIVAGRYSEAEQVCRSQPSFLSFVLLQGLTELEGGWSEVEKALEDALAEQAARLFRRIEYLSVLANLAPMLGLLGTVVGMVLCFQQVASTQGNAGAAQLAEGIYQALVTTVAGLMIAIPSLGAFAIFRNRVDQFVAEGAYIALHVFGPLKRRKQSGSSPTKPGAAPPIPPPPPVEGGR